MSDVTTDVTVVVASRNRRDQLLRHLPRHRAPVILVDNNSTDGTCEAVKTHCPQVRVIRLDDNIGAAARNLGVAAADTPHVAFADDDSWWDGDALSRLPALFRAHPRAALLAARVLIGPAGRLDPVSTQMAAAPLGTPADLPGPSILGFLACAVAVRRDAFLAVGGFEPHLHVYGEEALLAMDLAAAGHGLAYVDSLVVRHHPLPAGRDPGPRRRRQLRNDLLTTWLRRPAPAAARAARAAATTPDGRAALRDALGDLAWVLRHRHPVPAWLEADLRTLEAAPVPQSATPARAARTDSTTAARPTTAPAAPAAAAPARTSPAAATPVQVSPATAPAAAGSAAAAAGPRDRTPARA
ncbi:glycosyltransferase [Spirilliplanes yamanashiensis]|uniref:glycosyltransferase n=1 Tax=Spirilliplanes yamanashiensis TaxID=42233 RepID=UPI001EF280FF|nr:glycosyltransferase [Spirilliplanes yamanashiensis]MDP9816228.1 GT2 family glycosyltransferase [Spirilliplanes yamanashiensis]